METSRISDLRIAWTGPAVGDPASGGTLLGAMLLGALLDEGVKVDLYYPAARSELPASLREHPNLEVIGEPVPFEWDRWYSRTRVTAFISGLATRTLTQINLGAQLIRGHRARPYDAVFQFSQLELFLVGLAAPRLPPIVVHPCTTASRELLWHRRESRYALQSERRLQHALVRAVLHIRTAVQRHEVKSADIVAGPSEVFNRLLCEDYRVARSATRVLRHPVDVDRFSTVDRHAVNGRPVVLLYPSRLSTRKGLELIVSLSHRLADLAGQVEIAVLGGPSLWSDYTAHLKDLNPALARHIGGVEPGEMPAVYAASDIALVPSHYEPGSLVVGEALASGLPVVASDQVGPVEVVDARVCRVFPDGDLEGFEGEVRRLVADVRKDGGDALAEIARREAGERFSPHRIGQVLGDILLDAATRATGTSGQGDVAPETSAGAVTTVRRRRVRS